MKNFFIILSLFSLIAMNIQAADLTVTGNLDVQGNVMNLGSWEGQTNEAGLSFNYTDYPDDEYGEFRFSLNRSQAGWTWEHLGGKNSWVPAMRLDLDHSLVLYNYYSQWKVWLNPNGNSVFQNSLTVNGNNNLMPLQTLASDGSVLTRKLGDGRYVMKGSNKTALGYATATGQTATAFGGDSWATGAASIAGGNESGAYGDISIALGEAYAHKFGSVAIGLGAQSYGNYASAIGYNAKAYGLGSSAIGSDVQTSGNYASAFGLGTIAQSRSQTVIGQYNIAQGNPTNWVATDDLFVVGNGTSVNQRSNAFVVKKNGDATVKGNATVQGYVAINNNAYVQGYISSSGMYVEGPTEIMGDTQIEGNLGVGGSIWIAPQGDIPMGQFNQ